MWVPHRHIAAADARDVPTACAFSRFIDLPAPDYIGGYACWGYRGPDFRLLSGARADAPEVGNRADRPVGGDRALGQARGLGLRQIVTGPGGRS
jgi:hypothetical protein